MNDYYVYVYCDPRVLWSGVIERVECRYQPVYVGYGHRDRMQVHLRFRKGDRNLLKVHKLKAILEDGKSPVVFKVADGLSPEMAQDKEKELIAGIGTITELPGIKRGPLTNMTSGGDGGATFCGRTLTREHKEKIRNALKGVPHTELRKKHLSEAQCRRDITISAEKRDRMIAGLRSMTPEDKAKAVESWAGGVWIHKDKKHRRVKPDAVESYLRDGWTRGFLHGGNQHHGVKVLGERTHSSVG